MDHLHKQKFATFLVDVPLDTIWTCFQSYVDPAIGVWLLVHLTRFAFCLSLVHLFTMLCTHLGLPHPTIAHLSCYQCGHTIDDLIIHLFQCSCENEHATTQNTLQNIVTTIIVENGTRIEKGFPPFSPPHLRTSWYSYH